MISGPSSQGRRQVLVYQLDGGGPITGVLKGLSRSGLSLALPKALERGEVVRLILPPSERRPFGTGRTIIGHVVTAAASGNLVGIDFAWEVGLDPKSRPGDSKSSMSWWRRLLSKKASTPRSARLSRAPLLPLKAR